MKLLPILFCFLTLHSLAQPKPRHLEAVAYNPDEKKLYIYGGVEFFQGKTNSPFTLHEWDGTRWTEHFSSPGPGPRRAMSFVYDPVQKITFLFGGVGDTPKGDTIFHDVWAWNGKSWELKSNDFPLEIASAVFDPQRKCIYLLGESKKGVELWSYSDNKFENMGVDGPQTQGIPKITYDYKLKMVVVATFENQQLLMHTWDGKRWTRSACAGDCPEPRSRFILDYDKTTSQTILFGGRTDDKRFLNDAWQWDGKNWDRVETTNTPMIRASANSFATEDGVMIYGGTVHRNGKSEPVNEMWLLRDNDFRQIQ